MRRCWQMLFHREGTSVQLKAWAQLIAHEDDLPLKIARAQCLIRHQACPNSHCSPQEHTWPMRRLLVCARPWACPFRSHLSLHQRRDFLAVWRFSASQPSMARVVQKCLPWPCPRGRASSVVLFWQGMWSFWTSLGHLDLQLAPSKVLFHHFHHHVEVFDHSRRMKEWRMLLKQLWVL